MSPQWYSVRFNRHSVRFTDLFAAFDFARELTIPDSMRFTDLFAAFDFARELGIPAAVYRDSDGAKLATVIPWRGGRQR
jgi:hypothetical protein